jgi:hypothetical protein
MGIKVELLENHGAVIPYQAGAVMMGKEFAVQEDFAIRWFFKSVNAADKGAFPGARRTDNRNLFTLPDMEIDILQDFQMPERLTDAFQLNHQDFPYNRASKLNAAPAAGSADYEPV